MNMKMILIVLLLALVVPVTGCQKSEPSAIEIDHFFLGENYGRAGLVIKACGGRRPPDSMQIRATMMESADWAVKQGITFDQPRTYIDAPDLIGVDEWGQVIGDAGGWRSVSNGCYERVVEGAFNAVREWDTAGACPVTSFSLRLRWRFQQAEVERPCSTPIFIVYPAEQLQPMDQ